MSASLAAARKRRINASQNESLPQPPSYGQNAPSPTSGLTLPQVIALVDKRLITLEQFMKQQQSEPSTHSIVNNNNNNVPSNINAIVDEFNTRFAILAEEIHDMKNIVLKLQSFTMEVNKTLLDERIRIFSDVDNMNTNIDITKNINLYNLENMKEFSSSTDYLEQTGEFSMSKELENYNNEHRSETI
jgi:hypothetical protein